VQNAGRSNRVDPNAALIGALVTTSQVTTMESVKQGCEYEESQQTTFNEHYLGSLELLEACKPTTEP
jgi:hypothetical protein